MCKVTDHVLLSGTEKSRLSRCKCCGIYVLIYQNVYLTFNDSEFVNFKSLLKNLREEDFNKEHPSGEHHVLLKNAQTHMGVSFSPHQVEEVLDIIGEAEIIEEVFSIQYTK